MLCITNYRITLPDTGLAAPMCIALVADLHNQPGDEVLAALKKNHPDMITVVGDLMIGFRDETAIWESNKHCDAFEFLREASKLAPTFYSLGNHEKWIPDDCIVPILKTGALLLDNAAIDLSLPGGNILVGGLSTRLDLNWLRVFSSAAGFKLLLCHNPEYYPQYLKDTDINLILSGHTHGGQWRIGKQGIYAPGQGLFPKYTGGVYENRLVVSRGIANTAPVPRFGNPKELVMIDVCTI